MGDSHDRPVEQATAAPGEKRDVSLFAMWQEGKCHAYLESGIEKMAGVWCELRKGHDGPHYCLTVGAVQKSWTDDAA